MPATKNLAVIGALCLLGLVLYVFTGESEFSGPEALPEGVVRIVGIDLTTVNGVTLASGDARLELARVGDGWSATSRFGYAADAKKVETFLAEIVAISSPERRGSSSASHAAFEVDAASGLRVELEGSGAGLPCAITIGKVDSFDRVYLRFGDEAEVYSIRPNLRYSSQMGGRLLIDQWIDLTLLSLQEETAITGFVFETEEGTIDLRQIESQTTTPTANGDPGEPATIVSWKVISPDVFEADPAIVRGLRNTVRSVRGSATADPSGIAGYGLEPPQRTLTITRKDDEPIVIEIGQNGPIDGSREGTYGRRRGDDRVFLLPTYSADGLFKSLDQLRPPEPEPAPIPPPPTPDVGPQPPDEGGK